MSEGYNGWTNYETWCVALWLSNDELYYNETREMAQASHDADEQPWELAQSLREYVESFDEVTAVTEGPASFVCDLLGAALSDVDFSEIAENLLSELPDEVDA